MWSADPGGLARRCDPRPYARTLPGGRTVIDLFKMDALVNWLFAGAPPNTGFLDTVAELARRMIGAGLPLDTVGVYKKNLNPMVLGSLVLWTRGKGAASLGLC